MSTGLKKVHLLGQQLQSVRDRAVDDKNAIIALYSSVDPKHDARITAFSKFTNVLNSVLLSFVFISKHLLHKQWWDTIDLDRAPDPDRQIYINEFINLTKIAFVHGMVSAIESSFRLFLRALDPSACNGGMAEFKSIYECLFNSKLATAPPDGSTLLDLLRLVRNVIHNNGVYFNPRGIDVSLNWKGETFEFKQGDLLGFVTWEFLIRISDSLHELLHGVAEDANLRNITVEITDPISLLYS
jgi:hypothetical protein